MKRNRRMDTADFIEIWNSASSIEEVRRLTGIKYPSARASSLRADGKELKLFGHNKTHPVDLERQKFIEIWNSSESVDEVARKTGLSGVRQKASKLRELGYELNSKRVPPDVHAYYWSGVFDARAKISTSPKLRIRITPPPELLTDIKSAFPGATQETSRNATRLTWTGKKAKSVFHKLEKHTIVLKSEIRKILGEEGD